MKLTTVAGRLPEAYPWPPAVRGTIVEFSIIVRSTTAREVADEFASTAIASVLLGL